MKILVIIATYNAMQWAERCFNSIRSSSVTPDVFVVDNGSTDGTQAFIQAHYPEIMFQQSHENLGFGRANNLGLQYALDHHYDYVYLMNQDAWIFPDTLETLIDLSRRYPEYGIISPLHMNADLYHIDFNVINSTCSWRSNKDILNDMYNCNLADLYPVDFVCAAHWLIPCSVVKNVGGFSPSFQHYGEDDNYIHRVRWKNIKIGIAPKVKVVHDRGGREYSRKEELSLQYSNNIVLLSNPYVSVPYSSFKVLQYTFSYAKEYKSLKPLWTLMRIIGHWGSIINNRRISIKKQGAFLFS